MKLIISILAFFLTSHLIAKPIHFYNHVEKSNLRLKAEFKKPKPSNKLLNILYKNTKSDYDRQHLTRHLIQRWKKFNQLKLNPILDDLWITYQSEKKMVINFSKDKNKKLILTFNRKHKLTLDSKKSIKRQLDSFFKKRKNSKSALNKVIDLLMPKVWGAKQEDLYQQKQEDLAELRQDLVFITFYGQSPSHFDDINKPGAADAVFNTLAKSTPGEI